MTTAIKPAPSLSGLGAGWRRVAGLAGGAASIQIRPPHPQLSPGLNKGSVRVPAAQIN